MDNKAKLELKSLVDDLRKSCGDIQEWSLSPQFRDI